MPAIALVVLITITTAPTTFVNTANNTTLLIAALSVSFATTLHFYFTYEETQLSEIVTCPMSHNV